MSASGLGRLWCATLLGGAFACTVSLPDIEPERFACEGDARAEDGAFPCPESHACVDGECRPRLDCQRPTLGALGCEPDLDRCELLVGDELSRVGCMRGFQFETSTRPPGLLDTCACPDGTYCVGAARLAGGAGAAAGPALFVMTADSGPALPSGRLGIESERAALRVCARACGSEEDCSAGHTCRPAVVLQAQLLEVELSARSTVGVCMPDVSPGEVPAAEQLDPEACYGAEICRAALGRTEGICQANPSFALDHPVLPLGEAVWGTRRALRTHCVPRPSTSFKDPGLGCVIHEECSSQVCHLGRCALLCDPSRPGGCGSGRPCREQRVTRALPAGGPSVEDRLFLCDR